MKPSPLAGLAAAMALGAQAQNAPTLPPTTLALQSLDSVVVTAARTPQRSGDALRDTVVITRADIDQAGPVSLAELLQREALVEFRGTGGPGQPAGLFLRGANAAQTLVLVDGMRVGSATVGTTSIENIPLDLIERIEVVKGPLSSLYGPDAIGGVVQVFTRAGAKPRFFASAGFGTDSDYRGAAGFTAVEGDLTASFSAGARRVDAPSATNERAYCHDPDRDPYRNTFANLQLVQRLAQGETLTVSGFGSEGRTHFDGCPDAQGRFGRDVNTQTISGARISSFSFFAPWWSSRLTLAQGRDKLSIDANDGGRFETREDQVGWIHEFGTVLGTVLAGYEWKRQDVRSDTVFATTRRDTDSLFVSANQSWQGQRLEASARRDRDDQFGGRNTGSLSYGAPWPGMGFLTATLGRGFRAPTFFDLYAPPSDFYKPNPGLRPERSTGREIALRSEPGGRWPWRLAWFDQKIEDLITYVYPTVENVRRARIRGIEASVETTIGGVRVKGSLAAQRARDEDTGAHLQGRADRFGRLEASYATGGWHFAGGLTASGERFDSVDEAPGTRLPGYAIADATVRYAFDRRWKAELVASNLLDKRYEHIVGYDAPRRGLFLNVRYEAF
jgi:vitamin B12 transporter